MNSREKFESKNKLKKLSKQIDRIADNDELNGADRASSLGAIATSLKFEAKKYEEDFYRPHPKEDSETSPEKKARTNAAVKEKDERTTRFGLETLDPEVMNTDSDISKVISDNIEKATSILVEVVKEAGFVPLEIVNSNPLAAQVVIDSKDRITVELCVDPEEIQDGPSDTALIFTENGDKMLYNALDGPTDLEEALKDIKYRPGEYGVSI